MLSVNDLNAAAPPPGGAYGTMPIDKTLHTTVHGNRRYIAVGKHVQGSINTYNNLFTKWVMRLFFKKYVMDIQIDGKKNTTVCVNKKSYAKFLSKVGFSDKILSNSSLEGYVNFSSVMARATFLETNILMKDTISEDKANQLAHRTLLAIEKDDSQLALKLIGKGANFNKVVLLSSEGKRLNEGYLEGIPKYRRFEKARFLQLPLMLFAYYKSNKCVGDRLGQYGALNVGEDFEFERILESSRVERKTESVYGPKTATTSEGHSRTEYGFRDQERVYKHILFKDVRSNRQRLSVLNQRFECQPLEDVTERGSFKSLVIGGDNSESEQKTTSMSGQELVGVVAAVAAYGGLFYMIARGNK